MNDPEFMTGLAVTVSGVSGVVVGTILGGYLAALFKKRRCCICGEQILGPEMICKVWRAVLSRGGWRKLQWGIFLFDKPPEKRTFKCSKCGGSIEITIQDFIKIGIMAKIPILSFFMLLLMLGVVFKKSLPDFDGDLLIKTPMRLGISGFSFAVIVFTPIYAFLYSFLPIKKAEEKR